LQDEDYDLCSTYKALTDELTQVGAAVGDLERKKREAVEREDYAEAKRLKGEIEGVGDLKGVLERVGAEVEKLAGPEVVAMPNRNQNQNQNQIQNRFEEMNSNDNNNQYSSEPAYDEYEYEYEQQQQQQQPQYSPVNQQQQQQHTPQQQLPPQQQQQQQQQQYSPPIDPMEQPLAANKNSHPNNDSQPNDNLDPLEESGDFDASGANQGFGTRGSQLLNDNNHSTPGFNSMNNNTDSPQMPVGGMSKTSGRMGREITFDEMGNEVSERSERDGYSPTSTSTSTSTIHHPHPLLNKTPLDAGQERDDERVP